MWTEIAYNETGSTSEFLSGAFPKGLTLLVAGTMDGAIVNVRAWFPGVSTTSFFIRTKDTDSDDAWTSLLINDITGVFYHPPIVVPRLEIFLSAGGASQNVSMYVKGSPLATRYQGN